MQIPGLLIEYLINGSVALVWLFPLIASAGLLPNKIDTPIAVVVVIPALYVLGMVIDAAANFIVKHHKELIRKRIYKKLSVSEDQWQKFGGYRIETKLILHAPELARVGEKRSTRDRIARSSILNVMLATIIFTVFGFIQKDSWLILLLYLIGGAILIFFCWAMWARFQAASFAYEIIAFQTLEAKLEQENKNLN
ncbi:MAG: hypothetical protein CV087_22510 [Candidatus Brocadia sp. WS118]|nr:MAG: hypothetical protein CV087_22510 [Candidatus Brocadia sp. WS118]